MNSNALMVNDLYFSYGTETILKEIAFSLRKGEICAILGPNGAGKSTLLKCIDNIVRPQRGSIIIDNEPIHLLNSKELAKKLSFLPQEHNVSFPYTVFDVVLMGRSPYIGMFSSPSERDKKTAMESIRFVGIENIADKPYISLSGGQRKLVLIARALTQDAEVLIFDEPTNHLDFKNQFTILIKIKEIITRKSLSAVMSLHDPNLALRFAESVVMIKNGRIIAHGKKENVITEENLKMLYELDMKVITTYGEPVIVPTLYT